MKFANWTLILLLVFVQCEDDGDFEVSGEGKGDIPDYYDDPWEKDDPKNVQDSAEEDSSQEEDEVE